MHLCNNGYINSLCSHERLGVGERERERERERETASLLLSPRTSFSPVTIFKTKTSNYASYLYRKFAWETQTNDNLLHSRTSHKSLQCKTRETLQHQSNCRRWILATCLWPEYINVLWNLHSEKETSPSIKTLFAVPATLHKQSQKRVHLFNLQYFKLSQLLECPYHCSYTHTVEPLY